MITEREIAFLLGGIAIGINLCGFYLGMLALRKNNQEHPCPHGHINWDDCPDCCH